MVILPIGHQSVTLTLPGTAHLSWRKQLDPCLAANHLWVFINTVEELSFQRMYFHVRDSLQTSGPVLESSSAKVYSG